jgi:hypothetical protein
VDSITTMHPTSNVAGCNEWKHALIITSDVSAAAFTHVAIDIY